ncbi:MAG: hypothetical protein ACI86X_002138 [Moritella sp.]|jgi:hypothetical protein
MVMQMRIIVNIVNGVKYTCNTDLYMYLFWV